VQLESAAAVNARIGKLTDLATRNDLKVDEVQPAEASYGKDYGCVPIRLMGSGTYRTWTTFLHQLAQSFPDISVDSFELLVKAKRAQRAAGVPVNLVWYVRPDPSLAQAK